MRFTLHKVYPRWHRVEILRFSLTIFYQKKNELEYFLLCEIKRTFIHSASITISTRYTYAKLIVDKKIAIFYHRVIIRLKKNFCNSSSEHLNIKYNFIHFFSKRTNNFQEKFVKVWSPTLNIKKIKPTIFPFYLQYRNYKSFHSPL